MKLKPFAATAISLVFLASPALAGKQSPALTGNDISYPQCGATIPTGQAFGIVGVNGGKASNLNACFPAQLAWAKGSKGGTSQPKAAVYVNTGNPGDVYVTNPSIVSYWPNTGSNTFGNCTGGNDSACAYEYGKYMAQKDAAYVAQTDPTTRFVYWLDVETGNSWNVDKATNQADLIGMVDYFKTIGSQVGIYSTSYQWSQIAGSVTDSTNPLAGLNNWRPGARNLTSAQSNCSLAPLTIGGAVTLTQYTPSTLDYDFSCK